MEEQHNSRAHSDTDGVDESMPDPNRLHMNPMSMSSSDMTDMNHEAMRHVSHVHGDGAMGAEHSDHMNPSEHMDHSEHGASGQDHSGHMHMDHAAMFKKLLWYAVALAIPTIALDPMFAHLLGYHVATALLWTLLPAATGTIMYFWTGMPFLKGGVQEIKARKPGMMLLISLGITVAFVASWLSTLGVLPSNMSFWWELALLVVIMLAGHWIEMRSVMSTSSALDSISSLLPSTAHLIERDGAKLTTERDTDISDLGTGDVVVVRPGESIPADGIITSGTAGINESMITGESLPVTRSTGEKVVAGSISTDSSLQVRVEHIGEDTALSAIRRLVSQAQDSKTPTQLLADKAAGLLFWYATIAAAITAVVWLGLGQPQSALERVVTVLVIACPHALGLAIPLVVSIAMGSAAHTGILISNRDALETARTLTTVVFDKTGTLTLGTPHVVAMTTADNRDDADGEHHLLALAAAAEQESEHPLAQAIRTQAAKTNVSVETASDFRSTPGVGVSAKVGGSLIEVGGNELLQEKGLSGAGTPSDADALGSSSTLGNAGEDSAATRLFVLEDGAVRGTIDIADEIRPESHQAVADLKKRGITPVMLTGDSENVASVVASSLEIDTYFAQVRPEEKDAVIAELQRKGEKVAMVGDGVNDAPALARADIGIAIGAGTDVAIDSADLVLTGSDPTAVARAIDISERSVKKMRQNLWWAAGYNLVSVPLAAGVLAPIGFTLPMSVGAILMAVSTVIVVINARLLKRQLS